MFTDDVHVDEYPYIILFFNLFIWAPCCFTLQVTMIKLFCMEIIVFL
jgi:hypothetical protein